MIHFGVKINKAENIDRDKYAIINNKSSFKSNYTYDDEWCIRHQNNCLRNYDINMNYFKTLDKNEFDDEITRFVKKYNFEEVKELNIYSNVPGYYLMVLDNYCQAYIGTTSNIRNRIMKHWNTDKSFDRLIFGNVENSILSIDSFKSLDTTRIFVHPTNETFCFEDDLINNFLNKFLLNRVSGGKLENGISDVIVNAKTRDNDADSVLTITDIMQRLCCSRYEVTKYITQMGLPAHKEKNRYVIKEDDLINWIEEQKEKQKNIIIISVAFVIIGILIMLKVLNYI